MKYKILLYLLIMNFSNYAQQKSSITQFGITWTFDKEYETGQFINGDYWVVGPVKIVSVFPKAGKVNSIHEKGRSDYTKEYLNQYGDTDIKNDTCMRNGSMVNPVWSKYQGYDSGALTYKDSLSINFPYKLNVNQSLVSTISNTNMPSYDLLLPFRKEYSTSLLRTAAVLTCLEKASVNGAFRPAFAGNNKRIFIVKDIKVDKLPKLQAVENTPSVSDVARFVERPWLDHVDSWEQRATSPVANMASYGREFVRMVSFVSLRLLIEDSNENKEEKKQLLYKFIQLGIDLQGIRETDAKWNWGGGLGSGRKWPILFAGIMLDDDIMQSFPSASEFHEDLQTYYGKTWTGYNVSWQMIQHHGEAHLYEHKIPNEFKSFPFNDKKTNYADKDWLSHVYRVCCNGNAWIGESLAALLMGAKQKWNHDAFFDYCDRFMDESSEQYEKAGLNNYLEFYGNAYDPFVQNMWEAYRTKVPEQPGAKNNMMWEPIKKMWIDNNILE